VFGGVCGGLARYWNTDATLLRILTVVLTLATGGAFLIGYLIAWIAIPDEPMGPTGPFGQPADQVGYASGGNPSYADQGAQYIPPAPRERSYLGWMVLSAAVLIAGVLGLIGFLVQASVGIWGVILGVALATLGIGMLIGTRYGRARWLLWLAIPLAFVTFATVSASNFVRDNPNWERWTATQDAEGWGGLTIGDRTWVVSPEDAGDSPLEFQLSAGSAVLDLTDLSQVGGTDPAGPAQPLTIDAGVGVGELVILVPVDMQVELAGTVNLGQIKVPGSALSEGSDLETDTTINPVAGLDPAWTVTIDAAVGAGNLEVRREAA
jgi:phage shock protein PspC (stress-responsive transcriptional regulator)